MNQPPRKLTRTAPEGTKWFGGPVDRCKLSLRIYGEHLAPDDVTAALGHKPSQSWLKGDTLPGLPRVPRRSAWLLDAPEKTKGEIDTQIAWIFSRLTDDVRVWKTLGRRFQMDLNAVIHMESWNRGIELSPKSAELISRRGLKLGFDIYYYGEDRPNQALHRMAATRRRAAVREPQKGRHR